MLSRTAYCPVANGLPQEASLSVRTDSSGYYPNDPIDISGSVHFANGTAVSGIPVNIIVFPKLAAKHPVYDTTVITSTEGSYSDSSLRISEPEYSAMGTLSLYLKNGTVPPGRLYQINATAVVNGSLTSGSTAIEIRNSFLTSTNIALYMGTLWFILFIIAVWWPMKSSEEKPEGSNRRR